MLEAILAHPWEAVAFLATVLALLALSLAQLLGRAGGGLRAGRWVAAAGLAGLLGLALVRTCALLIIGALLSGNPKAFIVWAGLALALVAAYGLAVWWLVGWCRGRPRRALPIAVFCGGFLLGSLTLRTVWYCEPLAHAGWTQAQWWTAQLYAHGSGGARADRQRAIGWVRSAAAGGHARACYRAAEWERDPARRRELLRRAADAGLSDARYQLYRIEHDSAAAPELLQRAVAAGSPEALYELSLRLREQRPLDRQRALDTLVRAAEAGSVEAMYELAIVYARDDALAPTDAARSRAWEQRARRASEPRPTRMDLERWASWSGYGASERWQWRVDAARELAQRAESGDAGAQRRIARELFAHAEDDAELEARAIAWMLRAAAGGDVDAILDVVRYYERQDVGTAEQKARVFEWLRRAADAGNVDALHRIVRVHREGLLGRPVDLEAAREASRALHERLVDEGKNKEARWVGLQLREIEAELREQQRKELVERELRPAAESGDAAAQYELSRHVQLEDRAKAREWLLRAADGGYPPAQHAAALALLRGEGAEPERAAAWLRAAAEAGHRGAMYELGQLYRQRGSKRTVPSIPHDPQRALYWYQRALDGLEGDVVYRREDLRSGRAVETRRQGVERLIEQLRASTGA